MIKGWSNTDGCEYKDRPAITVKFKDSDKMKIIPIMSNAVDVFKKTDSFFECLPHKYGISRPSWLAWGFEADYDKTKITQTLRRKVRVDIDELEEKRKNYRMNQFEPMYKCPYTM